MPVYFQEKDRELKRRKDIHRFLKTKIIRPGLHYGTKEQMQKWMAVHCAHAPTAKRSKALDAYKKSFIYFAQRCNEFNKQVEVVSLGCGSGAKDLLLLKELKRRKISVHYVPCDINQGLVKQALRQARRFCTRSTPVVCDLEQTEKLSRFLEKKRRHNIMRVVLFFGMLPTLQPKEAEIYLKKLLKPRDLLFLSANLSLHKNYEKGIRMILPQYDNPETRDWLTCLLWELGMTETAGDLRFQIGASPDWKKLKRIEGRFQFKAGTEIIFDRKKYFFSKGEDLLLFFSNRHQSQLTEAFIRRFRKGPALRWVSGAFDEEILLSCLG